MNLLDITEKFISLTLILFSIIPEQVIGTKPVQYVKGEYRGLVVAIHSDVPQSEQLIDNLKELLRKSAAFLYQATDGRARFSDIEIIVPESWAKTDNYQPIAGSHFDKAHVRIAPADPKTGDEPYTHQPRGCGQPGEYIRLTDAFVEELNGRTIDNFGRPEKHLIHEWAHYRYGVFDEYGIPGDSKYPTFYMEDGVVYPTSCVRGIKGKQEDSNGRPCKIYSGGRVDPKCRFIADKSHNEALASIMFMPHIQSIQKFCTNDTNDPKTLHNKYAPNKQNILCGYRSTAEVIAGHEDFKNLNSGSLSDKYSDPTIRLLRIDEHQSSRFVLVLDVSGSMQEFGRISLLNRAATRFVRDLIPNGMELGIIEFHTIASVLHPMVKIDEKNRHTLAAMIPSTTKHMTAIGKGFKLALEILRQNGGETRGATIILVSDGEQNQWEPTIEEIMPAVLKAGVIVDSIAVGKFEADKRLENISMISGGRCFYMKDGDDATNTVMETAFMGFVSQQSDIEVQSVTILVRDLIVIAGRTVYKRVVIDSELGKNTVFMISSNHIDKVVVKFKAPDGQVFTEGHPNFKKESAHKHIQLSIPDSPVGHWEVIFSRDVNHNNAIVVALSVSSQPKNPKLQPIRVDSYFGKLEVRYPATAMLYAEVKRGQNAVIGANVIAIVDRPGAKKVEVVLYDDGSGLDVSANDGVYTTAFTQFSESGRYSVVARVALNGTQTRIRTTRSHYSYSRSIESINSPINTSDMKSEFEITDFIPTSGEPEEDYYTEPIAEFSRMSEAGAFKVEDYNPDIDLIPPGRVTDLKVVAIDEDKQVVELEWTAPGDDAFTGNATKIDLRVAPNPGSLHRPELFENSLSIIEDILVAGSIKPKEGGSLMKAKFHVPRVILQNAKRGYANDLPKISVYFALRAVDDSNNTGDISNVAFVHFGYVKPVLDIIVGTDWRPFETTVIQTHIVVPNPVLFYHNRILMQRHKNQTSVRIPKELGSNTRFTITSDDIDVLNITLTSPNGTIYGRNSDNFKFYPAEMMIQFHIVLANAGKWKVRLEKRNKETVIAYLSVASELRVEEPVKVRAWMDRPVMAKDKPPTAVITAEVTKRYNYIICANVMAVVDTPKGEPVLVQLHDNGLGADRVAKDGLYSGVFAKFNANGRYGVNARLINSDKAMLKLGVDILECN